MRTILFCFLLIPALANAQYKVSDITFQLQSPISKDEDLGNSVVYKGYKNMLYVVRILDTNDLTNYVITRVNLDTKETREMGGIINVGGFPIIDVAVNDYYLMLVGYNEGIVYNFKTGTWNMLEYTRDLIYHKGTFINDSLIFLGAISNHHPFDGKSGLFLNIYNATSNKFEKSVFRQFPGVVFSFLTVNWMTYLHDSIYVFTPLSGKIQVFDNSLEYKRSFDFAYKLDSMDRNIALEHETDSVNLAMIKGVLDSSISSDDFSGKGGLISLIDTIRGHYHFIEKVIPVNDSVVAVSLSKPGYTGRYRDLVVCDILKNKVLKVYSKWSCAPKKELQTPEDFFAIDLINQTTNAVYFYNDKAYFGTFHDMSIFKPGSVEEMKERIFNSVRKRGYSWTLFKYSYPGYN
jgi:hypothetical protein